MYKAIWLKFIPLNVSKITPKFSIIKILLLFLLMCSCKKKPDLTYKTVDKNKSVFLSGKVLADTQFLSDKKCKECHKNQFKKCKGSDHDKAMQIAGSVSVLADLKKSRKNTNKRIKNRCH
ncbi:MAG: hypothetical protein ACWIPJ_03835 [Polaribacter sp.]